MYHMSLMKVADAARMLNVETSTIYVYIARGMPHIRLSPRCIRFEEEDIGEWVEKCRSIAGKMGDMKSLSCKADADYTAFAHRTRPKPKRSNGKRNSAAKSSGLTNLVAFPSTASNKRSRGI
jgi:excisionase family DNA binding protein